MNIRARGTLEVRRPVALRMTDERRLRLDVLERNLAVRASALGLVALTADQFDVTDNSVAAQMARDGVVVDGAGFRDVLGHSLR